MGGQKDQVVWRSSSLTCPYVFDKAKNTGNSSSSSPGLPSDSKKKKKTATSVSTPELPPDSKKKLKSKEKRETIDNGEKVLLRLGGKSELAELCEINEVSASGNKADQIGRLLGI